ncbi:hypothetical protein, conserved [Eimeria praecox]|uniref:Uncharacterized protein n=1 Tax=Eimeria praecox TaxID=51316 RepID=U6GFY1_9EIME|nr:hypothetical protein, conserved [Eimeria praecox]
MQFVLGLDAPFQAACQRLGRLEAALWLLRRSQALRTLCATCAALHEEMSRAFTPERLEETGGGQAENKYIKSAMAPASSTCVWGTSSRDAALERFKVWKDNGDFNFACLKNAASIHLPNTQRLSVLHLILSRAEAATGDRGTNSSPNDGKEECEGAFLQRLKSEIYGGASAPSSSSSFSDTKSSVLSPASCPSTAPTSTQRCSCAVCLDADLAPHGPSRDWWRQISTMTEQKMLKTPSRKTFSPSTDTPNSQSPTSATAAKEQVLAHLTPSGSRLQSTPTGPEQVVLAAARSKPKVSSYPRASAVSYLYHYCYSVYHKSLPRNRLTCSSVRGAGTSQDTRSASDGLDAAIAIGTLYYCNLTGRQNTLAGMGRHLQQEVSVASRFRTALQGGGLSGGPSAASRATSRGSSTSPGVGGGGSASILRTQAPPAAEAASVLGCASTETERGLELACEILKNVHSAVPLLTDARSDLLTIQKGEAHRLVARPLEMFLLKQGDTEKTALSNSPSLSMEADGPPLGAFVATAACAAVAAKAAVKAQEAARRVNASESAHQPPRSLQQEEASRLGALATAGKHLHLEATDRSSRGSDRSIPCPTLLASQTSSAHFARSSRPRQPSTALPVPGKPARRIPTGSSSSTSDSPAQGRRAVAHLRNWSGGSAAAPPKQLHGRTSRYSTQPVDAPASHPARDSEKQQPGEPVLTPPLHPSAVTTGQQRRASGSRGVLQNTAFDRIPPQLRAEAADAASTASAVSAGASTTQRSPHLEPATVVPLDASVVQSGEQSSPSPYLLACSEDHFAPPVLEEEAPSQSPTESQSAQHPQRADSPAPAGSAA